MMQLVTFLCIFATCMATSKNEDVLKNIISSSCAYEEKVCPKPEYAIFDKDRNWEWNWTSVFESNDTLKIVGQFPPKLMVLARTAFCCTNGPCLYNCKNSGVQPELRLIANFPQNAEELFELKFEPLEVHREFVLAWARERLNGKNADGTFPDEVEDFFDTLSERNEEIEKLLLNRRIKNELELRRL